MSIPHFLARSLIGYWLRTSPESWRHRVTAHDAPHVHAPGIDADRILLVGDGAASGRGVTTHDLGLPGFLARALSARTGHATDVDIHVDEKMTVESCRGVFDAVNLGRYDHIVISVGHNEALSLMNPDRWRDRLHDLLDDLDRKTPATTPRTFLDIPLFGPKTALPTRLSHVVDRHLAHLNDISKTLIAGYPAVNLIAAEPDNLFEPETPSLYRRWADHIADAVCPSLIGDRLPASSIAAMDEMHRQLALEELELFGTGTERVLDELVQAARTTFGTPIAAVTLIASDYLTMRVAAGMEPSRLPRATAFCDVTIQHARHHVIEDTATDPTFRDYSVASNTGPAVRSYAGYPIESPDGYRVGAFCIMDTQPRTYTRTELATLRTLAQRAQHQLWPTQPHLHT